MMRIPGTKNGGPYPRYFTIVSNGAFKIYELKKIGMISSIVSIVIGSVLLIIGLIFKYFNIRRNSLFGYRTFLSMKSVSNWVFTNRIFARFAIIGIVILLVGTISFFIHINYRFIIYGTLTLTLIFIVVTEIRLKRFDENSRAKIKRD